jgi:uncharacterized protein
VIPLVDDHAHPFPLAHEPLDLSSLSLSVDARGVQRRRTAAGHRLMLEVLRGRLAQLLGCGPDEVLDAREDAARDWPAYVRRLFADAGIAAMLVDGVWPSLPDVDTSAHAATADVPMLPLLRLEPVIDGLLEQGADGPTIVQAVADFVAGGAAAGAAGLKTVLAYRTGLAVDPTVSAPDAFRSVTADPRTPVRQRAKPLRDYLMRQVFAQCADLGLPIQIHTGFGDSDIRLAGANPVLLDDVLRAPEGAAAKTVLIHAGYPWHEELAYLALVRDNVWAEISLVNLFSPITTADRLLRLIDVAPVDRVLFGTDGHGPPETHWFAASVLRDAWAQVAGRLATSTRSSWLDAAARLTFHDNAVQLYPGVAELLGR